MLQLYKESVEYITAEMQFLGDKHKDLASSQEARVAHFEETLRTMNMDAKDAMATQEELMKGTKAFTKVQRERMGAAV